MKQNPASILPDNSSWLELSDCLQKAATNFQKSFI